MRHCDEDVMLFTPGADSVVEEEVWDWGNCFFVWVWDMLERIDVRGCTYCIAPTPFHPRVRTELASIWANRCEDFPQNMKKLMCAGWILIRRTHPDTQFIFSLNNLKPNTRITIGSSWWTMHLQLAAFPYNVNSTVCSCEIAWLPRHNCWHWNWDCVVFFLDGYPKSYRSLVNPTA